MLLELVCQQRRNQAQCSGSANTLGKGAPGGRGRRQRTPQHRFMTGLCNARLLGMELTLFMLRSDKTFLSRDVLGCWCPVSRARGRGGGKSCLRTDRQRLSPSLNQWGTEILDSGGGERDLLDTTSDIPQAPYSALRIVPTGCSSNPVTPTYGKRQKCTCAL